MNQPDKVASKFARNVMILVTGTTIAQAIPIAVMPILTRLYTPEDFGLWAIFIAIVAIIGSIAAGRYELAIMLPRHDKLAINILALGVLIAVFTSLLFLFVVIAFNDQLIDFLGNDELSPWLYLAPFSVMLTALFNLLTYYNNRRKNYSDLRNAAILKSIVLAVVQLSVVLVKSGPTGLISGQIASQLIANTKLCKNALEQRSQLPSVTWLKLAAVAKRYKNFPRYSVFAALANTSSTHLINILIYTFYGVATLGNYALVQRALGAPSALIGQAVGHVLFQEASEEKRKTGSMMISFRGATRKLVFLGFPIFAIAFFFVEDLFYFVFGEEWRIAGTYAKILIPFFFVQFVVAPLTMINQVNLKNRMEMFWQIGFLIISSAILLIGNYSGRTIDMVFYMISGTGSLYYLYFYYLIYSHVSNKPK